MRPIDADLMVTVMLYDDEHEEYHTERMTIAECLDRYTEEGCPWEGAGNDKECHKPESEYYRAYCEERKEETYCEGCKFWY